MATFGSLTLIVDADLKRLQDKLTQAEAKVAKLGKTGMNFSLGMAPIVTLGLLSAAIAGVTDDTIKFDDAMRKTNARAEGTADELLLMSDAALRLAQNSGIGATEIGLMMNEIATAGFAPKEIEAMTEAVIDLTKATGTDSAIAGKTLARTINQFGFEATDAAHVADVLTVAANKSMTSVDQIGEAMSYAASTASELGMSFEETAAAVGILGDIGIEASSAGTAMRRLTVITGSQREALEEIFGTTLLDANGNTLGFIDNMKALEKATAGLSREDKIKKFSEAFGILGITSSLALSRMGTSIEDLMDEMHNSGGIAKKTGNEIEDGIGGAYRRMVSSIGVLSKTFGATLKDPLTELMDGVTSYIQYASDNLGNFYTWMTKSIMMVYMAGEWLWNNFGKLAQVGALLASKELTLWVVAVADSLNYVYALWDWVTSSAVSITSAGFSTIYENFKILKDNLVNLWGGFLSYVNGYGFKPNFKPFVEHFSAAIKDAPEFKASGAGIAAEFDRSINGLTDELNKSLDETAQAFVDFEQTIDEMNKQKQLEFTTPGKDRGKPVFAPEDPTKGPVMDFTDTTLGIQKSGGDIGTKGSAEAYGIFIKALNADKTLQLMRRQTELLRNIAQNTANNGSGLIVEPAI